MEVLISISIETSSSSSYFCFNTNETSEQVSCQRNHLSSHLNLLLPHDPLPFTMRSYLTITSLRDSPTLYHLRALARSIILITTDAVVRQANTARYSFITYLHVKITHSNQRLPHTKLVGIRSASYHPRIIYTTALSPTHSSRLTTIVP